MDTRRHSLPGVLAFGLALALAAPAAAQSPASTPNEAVDAFEAGAPTTPPGPDLKFETGAVKIGAVAEATLSSGYVYLADADARLVLRGLEPDGVFVSARTGEGVEELLERIQAALPQPPVEVRLLVPYDRGEVISRLHVRGRIVSTEYVEEGTLVTARVEPAEAGTLREFAVE